jgi:hypothetical protein
VALEGLELAGAPYASVEEFILLRQAIFLLPPPAYGFLERKEARSMTTTIARLPLGISATKLPSQWLSMLPLSWTPPQIISILGLLRHDSR